MNDATKRLPTPEEMADLAPVRISEIVLKTANHKALRDWYVAVLGTEPFLEREPPAQGKDPSLEGYTRASEVRLCFIRLHMDYPFSQVLAIFEDRDVVADGSARPGLHHMQFRHASLEQVVRRYERLRNAGVTPFRSANHGPGTSFYYRDPDGNVVELSGPNFETEADYFTFIESAGFKSNPSGIDIDPEEYVARFRGGVPQEELVRIPA